MSAILLIMNKKICFLAAVLLTMYKVAGQIETNSYPIQITDPDCQPLFVFNLSVRLQRIPLIFACKYYPTLLVSVY